MISERLLKAAPNMKHEREYDLMREAAEVIDALVAALEKARSAIEWWQEEHGCCAGATDEHLTQIDAALALARKEG